MEENDPNIVTSSKSASVLVDGHQFEIEIYRLEHEAHWTLEVVDEKSTSHVWDDVFATDTDALAAAMTTFEEEGAVGFLSDGNVVQFPKT